MARPDGRSAASDAPAPTVSVIIPTNRGGPYLREAVQSVRAQTAAVSEIILVDDGSPAPGLARVAADLRLTYVRQAASGISVARDTGVAHSASAWIAFLDDDDVWSPERIAHQLVALAANPDAVAAFTGGWLMDAAGERFGDGWAAPPATASAMLRGDVDIPRITTLLVRREAYLAAGGCVTAMEPAEDSDLILRLLQRGEFAAVDLPLVGYRRHGANVTATDTLRGRRAGPRLIRAQIAAARDRGDRESVELLEINLDRAERRIAEANVGDLIDALRTRRWAYAARVAGWGAVRLPVQSARAIVARSARRLRRQRPSR